MAEDPATLAAHQFGHVGVLFLGHQAAAGGAAIGEADKGELLTRPEDHLLGQAAEVHHDQAGGGAEFHREIPITDGIQAVGVDRLEAQGRRRLAPIDRHRGAGQGRRA